MEKLVDSTQAETIIRWLAHRFAVRSPRLRFTGHGGGRYLPWGNIIILSRPARERTVLHEFAHCLTRTINPRDHAWHGFAFYANLKRIAEAFYGDVKLHDWAHEGRYMKLNGHRARADGLIT